MDSSRTRGGSRGARTHIDEKSTIGGAQFSSLDLVVIKFSRKKPGAKSGGGVKGREKGGDQKIARFKNYWGGL